MRWAYDILSGVALGRALASGRLRYVAAYFARRNAIRLVVNALRKIGL